MLNAIELAEIITFVEYQLDTAEETWLKVGEDFAKSIKTASLAEDRAISRIPGHPDVPDGYREVSTFIAMMVDLRNSTQRFYTAQGIFHTQEEILKRMYLEISTFIPTIALIINKSSGNVTEILGDGLLALYLVDDKDKNKAIYDAYNTSKKCFSALSLAINPALENRYKIHPLEAGIGLALSKGIVQRIGSPGYTQDRVFGRCVFAASKLARGRNEIRGDKEIEHAWPESKGGILKFIPINKTETDGIEGFIIQKTESATSK